MDDRHASGSGASGAASSARSWIERAVAILLIGTMLSVVDRATVFASAQSDVHSLLDVPYVAQTPALCGGAAVAMVLRYWGEHEVFAQDFASLVDPGEGGILTGVLASAVQDRGWQSHVSPTPERTAFGSIRSEIDRGRPLIALIEVGPRTYHYVVIVGTTDHEVVLHDPARAPFRVLSWDAFDRAWSAADRWMMLILPPSGFGPASGAPRSTTPVADVILNAIQTPCGAMVERGVHLARSGDREGAHQGLVAATELCPNDSAPWRELAGLRFSESRWAESQDLALYAALLEPEDAYSWQLVATSRYLMGDLSGALDAWNRTGEPRIDTIEIHGAERTRQPVVIRAAGLHPRQTLTPELLGRARRRLRALPVARDAQLSYEPLDDGLAVIEIVVDERPVAPRGWLGLATLGGRTLLTRELRVEVAGPLGAGEVMSVVWRWSAKRPRVVLGLALPSPQWLPGTMWLDGLWERQSYSATASSDGSTVVRAERRRVGARVADWATSWLRWQTGAALDRLPEFDDSQAHGGDARDYLSLESSLDLRLSRDRVALSASAGWWAPLAGGDRFATGAFLAAWRSQDEATRPSWSITTEIAIANRVAPLALWQGAGTGHGRSPLLRAHPLLTGDVVTGPVFGRDVVHGSIEYVRPVGHVLASGLSIAWFVDAARAWHRLNDLDPSPLFVDTGIGLRVQAPHVGGAFRIDVAHGLRGGGTALSAGWGREWPR